MGELFDQLAESMGVKKEEREAIVEALAEARESKKGSPFRLAKSEEYDALAKAKADYDAATPRLGKLDAYEKRLSAIADKEFASLPKTAQERLAKRLP